MSGERGGDRGGPSLPDGEFVLLSHEMHCTLSFVDTIMILVIAALPVQNCQI